MPVQNLTPILNVSSVIESQKWFEALGWQRGFIWPDGDAEPGFGAVCSEKAEIFLCHGGQGSRGTLMPKHPGDAREARPPLWRARRRENLPGECSGGAISPDTASYSKVPHSS